MRMVDHVKRQALTPMRIVGYLRYKIMSLVHNVDYTKQHTLSTMHMVDNVLNKIVSVVRKVDYMSTSANSILTQC